MSMSAVITWSAPAYPNGVITVYRVTITSNGAHVSTNDVNSSMTSHTLSGLTPFTEYTVSVRGVTVGETGDSGPSVNFTTLEGSES